VRGAKVDKRLFSTSFLFLDLCKTLAILNKTWMGSVKGVVATLRFSEISFSENMQSSPKYFYVVFWLWKH
jgi:hypothetical protein